MKTLESSIADRINELIPAKSCHRDALVNHLTILDRAEDLNDSDGTLFTAVQHSTGEFSMRDDPLAIRILTKLKPTSTMKAA